MCSNEGRGHSSEDKEEGLHVSGLCMRKVHRERPSLQVFTTDFYTSDLEGAHASPLLPDMTGNKVKWITRSSEPRRKSLRVLISHVTPQALNDNVRMSVLKKSPCRFRNVEAALS